VPGRITRFAGKAPSGAEDDAARRDARSLHAKEGVDLLDQAELLKRAQPLGHDLAAAAQLLGRLL